MTSQTRSVVFTVGVNHLNRVTLPAEPFWAPAPPIEEARKVGEPEWEYKTVSARPRPQVKRQRRVDVFASWDEERLAAKLAEEMRRSRQSKVVTSTGPDVVMSERTLRVMRYLARREDTLEGIANCVGLPVRAVEKALARARSYRFVFSRRANPRLHNVCVYSITQEGLDLLKDISATPCAKGAA